MLLSSIFQHRNILKAVAVRKHSRSTACQLHPVYKVGYTNIRLNYKRIDSGVKLNLSQVIPDVSLTSATAW